MIKVSCAKCGKSLRVDDSRVGKMGQCPDCGAKFRIAPAQGDSSVVRGKEVGSTAKRASASSSIARLDRTAKPAKKSTSKIPASLPAAVANEDPGFEVIDEEPQLRPAPVAESPTSVEPASKPKKKKKKKKPTSDSLTWGGLPRDGFSVFFGLIVIAWMCLFGIGFFSPTAGTILWYSGWFLEVCGWLWLLHIASEDSGTHYLLIRFFPPYSLVYVLVNFADAFKPFLIFGAGITFIASSLVLLVVGAITNPGYHNPGYTERPVPRDMNEIDTECARLLKSPGAAEAREWLNQPGSRRELGPLERDESVAFVEDAYKNGAEKVFIANPHFLEGTEMADDTIIVLPTDLASRQRVFAWYRAFSRKHGDDPVKDIGQKYLLYRTDPD